MKNPFIKWLIVLGALVIAGGGIGALLWFQGAPLAARWIVGLAIVAVGGWLIWALIKWRQVPWVRRFTTVLLITVAAALLAGVCWTMRWWSGMFFILSAWSMGMVFVLGLGLLRLILSPGLATIGVARTLLDEAIRMKAPLIFIVMLIVFIPLLPQVIANDSLHARLETFLTWSMIVVSALLSLMTIFLAVGSVTGELTQRQIFMTLTKPVGRGRYLLGKWLGIALLDLLLLAVAGAGIYGFARILQTQQAQSAADRRAVTDQVLTARASISPNAVDPQAMAQRLRTRLKRLRKAQPETYGQPGQPLDALPDNLRQQLRTQVMTQWYSLGPRERKTYRFTGLGRARDIAQTVQFRLKPTAGSTPPGGLVRLAVQVNGKLLPSSGTGRRVWALANDQYHILEIPTSAINQNGNLNIELFSPPLGPKTVQPSVSFNLKDGLEMLYKVGSFEMNLLRSLGVLWIRLCFLSMLGIFASTFLGFPVAAMLCALVYLAAAGHGYLSKSFEYYAAFPDKDLPTWQRIIGVPGMMWEHLSHGETYKAIKVLIKLVGMSASTLIPSFANYDPTPRFAHGRLVPWAMLWRAGLFVGIIWSGGLALAGWLIFRKKELGQVTA